MRGLVCLLLFAGLTASGAGWENLLNGKNLDGWEIVGDGLWNVMRDGALVGQRDLSIKYEQNLPVNQSWLYTKKEFGEYDLHVEWWTRHGGNSGVSIRDTSRAIHSIVGPQIDAKQTPSHVGYEIQISNGYRDQYPSGSVYLFDAAKTGSQIPDDWNTFDIEVRDSGIKVTMNGVLVSQYKGEPGRPLKGPIGLQLHDPTTVAMFRNIRIKEVK
ncbi:MAG TPA: DUF1080 domain-containing protein [Bryobacteraceae bacterium]|nr:DUF1080 domain-containing protein [Bryobacteraceae bacterium]